MIRTSSIEAIGARVGGSAAIRLSDRAQYHPESRQTSRITEIEFCAWVAQAEPGNRLEYHRGFLAFDVHSLLTGLSDAERDQLRALGARAFHTAEAGLVHLVQERLGPDCFAYIAIARPRPKTAAASLSAVLLQEAA
jgi:predicted aconitase